MKKALSKFFKNKTKRNITIAGAIVVVGLAVLLTNLFCMSDNGAKVGDHVFVHYTGMFQNGEVFDSSVERGIPIDFILGAGRVIKGWDEGIVGMEVGEKKHLVISPDKAYGSQPITDSDGNVVIPANSTLVFDVELVAIEK